MAFTAGQIKRWKNHGTCDVICYSFAGLAVVVLMALPFAFMQAEEASHQCEFQEEMTTQVILIGNMFGIVVHAWCLMHFFSRKGISI